MSDTQVNLTRNRRPLLRAAALKHFDVRVYNPKTKEESPFDLKTTAPGCYLSIYWKVAPPHITAPLSVFPSLKSGEAGVEKFSQILYIDPASLAYELQALAVSDVYGGDARELEFQRTKLLRGLWSYVAIIECSQQPPPSECDLVDFSQISMFWSMILHFHRTGECLPPMDEAWSDDKSTCCFQKLIVDFANVGAKKAAGDRSANNKELRYPSKVMSFVLYLNQMMRCGGPNCSKAVKEKNMMNVDFEAPLLPGLIPEWWRLHNELWTSTLKYFIDSGCTKAPCMWLLKESGCKGKNVDPNKPTCCKEDHTFFVPKVKALEALLKKPFSKQMSPIINVEATGQGVTISKELLGEEGSLTVAERQNKLKEAGNDYVAKQDYTAALMLYNEAIKADPRNPQTAPAIYSNRSLCYVCLSDYKKALADADTCVELRPNWFRGHFRRGFALERMQRYGDAIAAFNKGLAAGDGGAQAKKDADEHIKLCENAMVENSRSKSAAAQAKGKNTSSAKKTPGTNATGAASPKTTVTAVLFPCDPNRRPYEVSIPSDIVGEADTIHSILGITPAQVENIEKFIASSKTIVPPGTLPPDVKPMPFGVHEWAAGLATRRAKMGSEAASALAESQKGDKIGYAFQPREICRGENDKRDLMLLINPQSREQPNFRVCAMLTKINENPMNLTDGNPSTCKCRGDALLIRINRGDEDSTCALVPKSRAWWQNYFTDRRVLEWEVIQNVFEKFMTEAKEAWVTAEIENGRGGKPEGKMGVYVQLAAAMNELLQRRNVHYAVDFTYEEYDKVWGLFTQIQIPSSGKGKRSGRGGEPVGEHQFLSILFPNTKEAERDMTLMVKQIMARQS